MQAGMLYRQAMSEQDRENLVGNIADHLGKAQKCLQLRRAALFYKCDPDYGLRVSEGLQLDPAEVEKLAAMTSEERAEATKPGGFAVGGEPPVIVPAG